GLTETVELAKSAVSASGGDYAASFRFKQIGTIPTERNETILVSEDGPRNPNKIVAFTLYNWYGNYINTGIVRGGGADTLGYAIDINKKRVLTVSPDGKVNATSFITGSGGMQTGAKDAASFEGNNIEIQSWYGIGLKATIDGETRTFFDTRTGNIITKGTFGIGDDCNGIRGGGRDAASFEGNNIEVVSWYGIGLKSTLDNKTRIFFNTRNGDIFTKGTIHIGDAIHYYDGNTTGSIWGGDLHSYINNNFSRKNDGIPVGSPIPWPLPNPPSGYLTCNGQSFNKSLYPQLAVAYPSGVLPDLRGEFIRGWDDGRGVDGGRGILSWQPQQVQWHQHLGGHGGRAQGAFGVTNLAGHPGSYHDDSKQTLPFTNNGSDFQGFTNNGAVGAETRPRNIAFNYIVRAA
ncbi:tail fiber protein, partial [Photorhabdus bodei]